MALPIPDERIFGGVAGGIAANLDLDAMIALAMRPGGRSAD